MATTTVTLTYTSSLVEALTLKATAIYPTGGANLPILVAMHGFSSDVATGFDATKTRFADGYYYHIGAITGGPFTDAEQILGDVAGQATLSESGPGLVIPQDIVTAFEVGETIEGQDSGATAVISSIDHPQIFALFVEMRGRGSAGGDKDSGGREVQDIIDAIDYVLANYPTETDATQIHIAGWSGGGGNAFSCIARFPDKFNSATSFYGISDYGFDTADGWYQNAAAYQAALETQVGGMPGAVPDNYHARASVLAIANYTGGKLWLFHDAGDGTVQVVNSRNVRDQMAAFGLSNFTYSETTTGDDPRWSHNNPVAGTSVLQGEPTYLMPISNKDYPAWTIPTIGALGVPGWVDTSRFSLWLDTGLSEYARVAYNLTTRQFTIFGYTGQTPWILTLKGQSISTAITSHINGKSYTETSDGDGVVIYTDTVIRNLYAPLLVVGGDGL